MWLFKKIINENEIKNLSQREINNFYFPFLIWFILLDKCEKFNQNDGKCLHPD